MFKTKLLLEPEDLKPSFENWTVKGVINPAVIRMPNKKIMMFARVAEESHLHSGKLLHCPVVVDDSKGYKTGHEKIKKKDIVKRSEDAVFLKSGICRLTTFSHFRKIVLDESGFEVEHIGEKPIFTGTPREGQFGVEDPRFIKIGKKYYMTYVAVSMYEGVSTALAVSKDLIKWKRLGIIFREQNKDVVLFPEKIKGKYVAIHRPEGFFEFSKPSMWISYSPDLIYWGREGAIIKPRPGAWDQDRIGAGAPPIKTKKGWLEIYHGVRVVNGKKHYKSGALLLDLKNPEKILARSAKNAPLIKPEENYEKKGFINNVVFPTGIVPDLNKKDVLIYSGGADSVITVRKIPVKKILSSMEYL
jgi:predicted GH43/DUF377 family glycosyl hydrolase